MIRATTIGVLKNYRYGLNNSFTKQNDARTTVLTHRNFNSFAEDPAAAARSFQLRRSRMVAQSQYSVCDTSYRRFQSAWSALDTVINDVDNANGKFDETIKQSSLEALNDPTGDARTALAKVISETADALVQVMNNTYAGTFLFSGADGQTVPFSWGDNGELLYRGIPVDAAVPDTLTVTDAAGKTVNLSLKLDADGHYDATNGTETYFLNGKAALVEFSRPSDNDIDAKDLKDILSEPPADAAKDVNDKPVIVDKDGNPFADDNAVKQAIKDGNDVFYKVPDQNGGNDSLVSANPYVVAPPDNALTDTAGKPVILRDDGTAYTTMDEVKADLAAGKKISYVTVNEGGTISEEDYNTEVKNAEKLRYLSEEEKLYQDIGLGNKEDENGKVISSSVFDSTLQGINFLGYGKDADGDPKNIVSIVKQMGDIMNKVKDGQLSQEDYDDLFRLTGKFEDAADKLKVAHDDMDARSSTLKNNLGLLEGNVYDLVEQYAGIEDVDDAEAISAFLWASYSYNAALRVGNSVLSQSLMDYMQ